MSQKSSMKGHTHLTHIAPFMPGLASSRASNFALKCPSPDFRMPSALHWNHYSGGVFNLLRLRVALHLRPSGMLKERRLKCEVLFLALSGSVSHIIDE